MKSSALSSNLRLTLLFIGTLSLQFYILPSGLPQLSHFILLFLSFWAIFQGGTKTIRILKQKNALSFVVFVIYAFIVNTTNYFIYRDDSFLINSLYFLFNFIIYLGMICLFYEQNMAHKVFLMIRKASFVGIIFLLIAYLIGGGRFFSFRYMGFFNDPNQMSFWILCSIAIYLSLSKNIYLSSIIIVSGVFLVLLTASRSGLLGLFLILFGFLLNIYHLIEKKRIFIIAPLVFFILLMVLLTSQSFLESSFLDTSNNSLITKSLNRLLETDVESQLGVRGYDLPKKYPEYLLFGAGQGGLDYRFGKDAEIHSTWVGIFFYYGIIGLLIFLSFFLMPMRSLRFAQICLFLGPAIYAFSTYSARTPVFYLLLFVFGSLSKLHKGNNESSERIT